MSGEEGVQAWQDHQKSGKSAFTQGNYAEAERSWSLALSDAENFGENDPRLVRSLLDLATLYQAQSKYSEAEPLFKRALAITETVAGHDNPRVAVILNNLGAVYHAQRQHWDAEAAYRRALAISINTYGPFHLSVATAFNNLAELCREQGRYLQAEPMYRYVLAVHEFLDPTSISVAAVLNNLVFLLCARGRYYEAKELLQRALTLEKPGTNQPLFESMRKGYELLAKRTDRGVWASLKRLVKPGAK